MKWIVPILMAADLVLAASEAEARKVSAAPRPEPNRIDIKYVEPQSAAYQPLYKLLKEHQALEKIRDLLSPLRLPHRLLLETRDCEGISNAFSNELGVTVCYEFIDEIWKKAPEKTTPSGIAPIDTLIGPLMDVFLHEAGHAIFAVLRIPLFGREEDAADQFSTYVMLRFDKEEARRLILLRGRPEAVRRCRRKRISARGPRRDLQARIHSAHACIRDLDRPAYR
jgi:Putative metallopeptidase